MIETERLVIKPLTYLQLLYYLKADNSLERELNLIDSPRTITPELNEALEQTKNQCRILYRAAKESIRKNWRIGGIISLETDGLKPAIIN